MNKKLCILTDSLSNGGAERVASNMSVSLANKGYNITVVSMQSNISYAYEGELYNFGKVKEANNKLKAFLKFRDFFKNENFDVIIDHRVRNNFFKELLFSKLIFNKSKVIYCIHSYLLSYSFSYMCFPRLARLPHVKNRIFVSVCNEVNRNLEQQLGIKSKTIYNYLKLGRDIDFEKENYIIGVGRLTKIKQFDKLILAYNESELPKKSVGLRILGNGEEKENLKKMINNLELNKKVKLISFKNDPKALISKAMCLVLVSEFEGFGMVLLEALNLGTPVISYNCKSGPSEIIQHEINGLLVENKNKEELIKAMNKLVLDEEFYNQIKLNTSCGLEKFSEEQVIAQWETLL
ncbi:glycosyltransferase [Aestuariibaculum marinum]|uniref:Glycosyltransferase n=1 Tax=Aestuariibaculum marinum TaxID=2683592 RepID=A0A8J6PWL5_9FLAO|nr:glycosyltransferase [Aestuariibaculum marinum]MBD0824318.1 glycosyltransferase [Aestuariibaculum marinum]